MAQPQVPEWCILRIVEELYERSLHLLDGQRMLLELLFRELVAVDVFDNSDADDQLDDKDLFLVKAHYIKGQRPGSLMCMCIKYQ